MLIKNILSLWLFCCSTKVSYRFFMCDFSWYTYLNTDIYNGIPNEKPSFFQDHHFWNLHFKFPHQGILDYKDNYQPWDGLSEFISHGMVFLNSSAMSWSFWIHQPWAGLSEFIIHEVVFLNSSAMEWSFWHGTVFPISSTMRWSFCVIIPGVVFLKSSAWGGLSELTSHAAIFLDSLLMRWSLAMVFFNSSPTSIFFWIHQQWGALSEFIQH